MELRVCLACRRTVTGSATCSDCGGAVTLADPALFVGESFGKYLVESLVGIGGMGAVFRATHRTLRRPVAVKMVLPEKDDETFRRRFLREARVLAEVHHPNVVEVYDFDVNDWGISYLVMEYLEGESLKDRLRRTPRLGWADLGPVIRDVAEGLGCAHRAGVIHRDLKPDNLFLADYGGRRVAKVIDFGIAKSTTGDQPETQLTQSGFVVGTLAYLAPEQLLGSPVGPAADQYALALVAAEALTGRAVRAGKTMGQIISADIVQPVELPRTVAAGLPEAAIGVIRRATAPEPADRFETVEAFAAALDGALEGHPGPFEDLGEDTAEASVIDLTSSPTRMTPESRRDSTRGRGFRRWPFAAGAAVAIAAAGLALVALMREPQSPSAQASPNRAGAYAVEAEIPVPLDAGRLLTFRDGRVVVEVADGLAVADGSRTERIGIPGSDIFGTTPDGELLRRSGRDLQILDVTQGASAPWVSDAPTDDVVHASPDARHLASVRQEGIVVFRLAGDRYEPVRTHPLSAPAQVVRVSARHLVVATSEIVAWRLEDGREVLRAPAGDGRILALAVHDLAGLVAVGGWSDRVLVYDLNTQTSTVVARPKGVDRHLDLEFLLPGPTLAMGERGGVGVWQPGAGRVQAWEDADSQVVDLLAHGGRLVALDKGRHRAVVLMPPGAAPENRIQASDQAPWAVGAVPGTNLVLVGGSDGTLHSVDTDTGVSTPHVVHSLGITSLVAGPDRVATASDDKTVAVWRLPELTVEWRSRAHDFLVNQLHLDGDGQSLWSTSSDGVLKRWSWPDLELRETVDTEEIFGRRYSLHALWMAEDGNRALLGTWNRAVLILERSEDGAWAGHAAPFGAFGGYLVAELTRAEAVVISGVLHPYSLGVLDLATGRFQEVEPSGRPYHGLVPNPDGTSVLAFGHDEVVELRFRRGSDGGLVGAVAAAHLPGLGMASAATRLSDGRLAVTNDRGELMLYRQETLGLEPLTPE